MARGPRKHMKRLASPYHWMLDKLSGVFAPRPRSGPHKLRECLPLTLILRHRLRYALNAREVSFIVARRLVKVDGVVRTDPKYPCGFMDVLTIDDTNDKFRLSLDIKGRACLVKIPPGEEKRKLLRVNRLAYAPGRVPYAACHDGHTVRYPDPMVKKHDTLVYNLQTKQVEDFIRFKPGHTVMITGGANTGRIGRVDHIERHPGSFDIVHVEDAAGNKFSTRITACFVIGKKDPLVTVPKAKGVRIPLVQDRLNRIEEVRKRKRGGRN
eukprot:NODE_3167_length_971_cov_267.171367_g2637_i0.p1 GENE.NODE_3167_length_971_cov_267.171367_g2637_i0~~NODE_3167_length_971_cov_267.171367_g2637_i0.p1  ORF type:complete len:268 (+),score=68.80 NODE_3167_length_971_cov_267.171367_g2637_i0:87-890(+)